MPFTSDLTIDEVLLVEEAGFEPLELVMGSSYFNIGWQKAIWTSNVEFVDQSRVMCAARSVAIERMVRGDRRLAHRGRHPRGA